MKNTTTFHPVPYKIEFSLKRETEGFEIWDFPTLTSTIFSMYYKSILFENLVDILRTREDLENIVVFEKSMNISDILSDKRIFFDEENLLKKDNIGFFYFNLGAPIPMFPNAACDELRIFFQSFDAFEKLHDKYYPKENFKGGRLGTAYNYLMQGGIEHYLEIMNKKINRPLSKDLSEESINIINIIRQKAGFLCKQFNEEYYNFADLSRKFVDIQNSIKENALDYNIVNVSENKKDLISKYYQRFFNVLSSNELPCVAIYSPENDSFEFISLDVLKGARSPLGLDIRKYTHNSPYCLEYVVPALTFILGIAADIWIKPWLLQKKQEYINRKKKIEIKSKEHELEERERMFLDMVDFSNIGEEGKSYFLKQYNRVTEYNFLIDKYSEVKYTFTKEGLIYAHNNSLKGFERKLTTIKFDLDMSKKIRIYPNE